MFLISSSYRQNLKVTYISWHEFPEIQGSDSRLLIKYFLKKRSFIGLGEYVGKKTEYSFLNLYNTLLPTSLPFILAASLTPKHLPFVQWKFNKRRKLLCYFPKCLLCAFLICQCFDWQLYMTLDFNFTRNLMGGIF